MVLKRVPKEDEDEHGDDGVEDDVEEDVDANTDDEDEGKNSWVHFRFGRFGDELLFGTQHVLNVHFGSRPKWTCKVQTQGLCFCDTRCVLVFRCPLNLVGVAHL